MRKADLVFVPSKFEQLILSTEYGMNDVVVMPYMVDPVKLLAASSLRSDILFLGGYRHPPNVDAVLWFHAEVWPTLSKALPEARFVIAGASPPSQITELASSRVVVTGRIDDLGPTFASARAFVVPLRYGAGVKGKIFSAMAHGVPVVSTSSGAEGIDLIDGQSVLIADTPEAFAQRVMEVFADDHLAKKLSAAGSNFIDSQATLKAGIAVMRDVLAKQALPPIRP
jgi:glycosyltransferase involved in cell wall biosynthesis